MLLQRLSCLNSTDCFLDKNYKQGILAHHNIYQFQSIIPLIFFVVFENAINFLAFLLLEQLYIYFRRKSVFSSTKRRESQANIQSQSWHPPV